MTVGLSIVRNAVRSPDSTAIFGSSNLTYGQLNRRTNKIAHYLNSTLKKGDRVALFVANRPEVVEVVGGVAKSGCIYVGLNFRLGNSELHQIFDNSEPSLLITDEEHLEMVEAIALEKDIPVVVLDSKKWEDQISSMPETVPSSLHEVRHDDDFCIVYTSGTTGRPKAAMITHENLISNSKTLTEIWAFSGDDKLIHALPVYHTHGLFVATNVILLSSASMFFLSKFDIDIIIKLIPKSSTIMGVPTYYARLLESPKLTRKLTQDMRLIVSGSAPLTKEMSDKFFERTGKRILERYGMTETNMISSNPYDGKRKAGSVGYPLPGINLRICNPETGLCLPAGKVGEIELKGKNVFSGYWRMQKETQEAFRLDGFFRTGDLGKFDNQGYIEIVGRLKDLIITGGLNVYPKEVENVLNSFVGIEESAVIGLPHDDFGESILAVIISEKGNKLYEKDVIQYLEDNLAKYKCPKAYVSETSLPRNNLGKVLKNLLREKYRNYFTNLKKS